MLEPRDKLPETQENINRLRSVRTRVEEWVRRAEGTASADALDAAANVLKEKLGRIEAELIRTEPKGARDRLIHPVKMNAKLAGLIPVVVADFRPQRCSTPTWSGWTSSSGRWRR